MKPEPSLHSSQRLIDAMANKVDKVDEICQASIARIEKGALCMTQTETMISKTRELLRSTSQVAR